MLYRSGRHEQLFRMPCPKGCGQEVLLGEDGRTFETEPRHVLEVPSLDQRNKVHPYSGFVQPDGVTRMVQRALHWFEHECHRKGFIMPKPAITVEQLIAVLQTVVALDPRNAQKLVVTTSEAGYAHEHVSGVESVDDESVTLGEAD